MNTIGIICISTGIYNAFWKDFYQSVDTFFCSSSQKNFYLFTDDKTLIDGKHPNNVHMYPMEDRGWVLNIIRRSELFLSIKDQLRKNDFIFNLNLNYRAVTPIDGHEIIPTGKNEWLCGLSFNFYRERNPDTYTYERNPLSRAYIPSGNGKHYFQGGFYGGRTKEFLEMSAWIWEQTEQDLAQGITPVYLDESYLNRYFLERNPLIIGTKYAKAEQWGTTDEVKGILLDKNKYFGQDTITNLKSYFVEPDLKFLTDSSFKANPIGIINLYGGLGNQMFQYALLVSLSQQYPNRKFYLNLETLPRLECHRGYQLNRIFNISDHILANNDMIEKIKNAPKAYTRYITESEYSKYTPIEDSTHPIWIVSGYWQSEKYLCPSVREHFKFNGSILTEYNKEILTRIRKTDLSVAIHIRRGDYTNHIKTFHLMGGICTPQYYQEAAKLFDQNSTFYIFSDDIEWCKEYIQIPNCVFVTQTTSNDDWQDMILMASCKHQIIANSSFSWWAAWLNRYPAKKVVTPPHWYNHSNDYDMIPESWHRISLPPTENKYANLTIVIPVRIDSEERKRNLNVVLQQLVKLGGLKIIVLEADLKSKVKRPDNVQRVFIEDSNPIFYRTKYINILCSLATTDFMGVWDTDIIISPQQIEEALLMLQENKADMVYPYDGRFYNISNTISEQYAQSQDDRLLAENVNKFQSLYNQHSCGGAFMVNRKSYMEAGGENEKFCGWGPEDLERYKRWEVKGYKVARTNGIAFHLDHPRGKNSRYNSKESKREMYRVLFETCRN